jgi:hypothetical protein
LVPLDSATNPPRIPAVGSIGHTGFQSGELRIAAKFPLYGYISTTINGVGADLFPLYKNRVNVSTTNLLMVDNPVANSDVATIGY